MILKVNNTLFLQFCTTWHDKFEVSDRNLQITGQLMPYLYKMLAVNAVNDDNESWAMNKKIL